MKVVAWLFAAAVSLTIAAAGCGGEGEAPEARGEPAPMPEVVPTPSPAPEPAEPEEDPAAEAAREDAIKRAIKAAEAMLLDTRSRLKPTAADCLWGLNNEDPAKALEVAECMNRAEVFNDFRACIEPCRPPDPSLSE